MERNMVSLFLQNGDGELLLLHREGGRVANGLWVAGCGGHMEKDELNNARQAVLREMKEELGLEEGALAGLSLRYITLRNAGDEIRINYYFFARLTAGEKKMLVSNEGQLKWCEEQEILQLPMPVTAHHVMEHYFSVGRHTSTLYGGVGDENGMQFMPMETSGR